ncbi:hypothetical protein [Escherichia phage FL12]
MDVLSSFGSFVLILIRLNYESYVYPISCSPI